MLQLSLNNALPAVPPMSEKLCELKKVLKTEFTQFVQLVSEPTHVCKRCGRCANSKKLLCKPERLPN